MTLTTTPAPAGDPRSVRSLALLWVAAVLLVACGDDPTADRSAPEGPASASGDTAGAGPDSFVADVADSNALVAAVIEDDDDGGRSIRAYICDGTAVSEWFTGDLDGAEVTLSSADGDSSLEATVSDGSVDGTITLADRTAIAFAAEPAEGIAGLYDVTTTPDGRVTGTNVDGNRYEGRADLASLLDGEFLEGDLIGVDGEVEPVVLRVVGTGLPTEPIESRFIFLSDTTAVGASLPFISRDDGDDFISRDDGDEVVQIDGTTSVWFYSNPLVGP